jgi:DNA-binding NarL/FixJ family response regulator
MPPVQPAPVRVFLCDDVQAFRALLRFSLEDEPDIEVCGEAADGLAGVDGVRETQPDVVLLDLAMPGCDGLEALPLMREASPASRVIALSGFEADRMAQSIARQGAWAYLEKGVDLDRIVGAVRRAGAAAAAA